MRHLLSTFDLSSVEFERIFAITEDLKTKLRDGLREPLLPGRVMALLFEKPSLRTRVSFEAGMAHLGGRSLFLTDDVGFGVRESMADFARVLSEYVDVIVYRGKAHARAEELASHCSCSVINGLTDYDHPCQAVSDLYTLRERFGSLRGRKLAFIGDGNNVARALAVACGRTGVEFVLSAPAGYEFDEPFLARLRSEVPGFTPGFERDPARAVAGAVCVYTDVWTSMGQEAESARRRQDFAAYRVDARLMARAPAEAVFMHCLPAHRGEEVTDDVLDGPQSVVVPQAGNRMHAQKGVLTWLLGAQS